MNIDRQCFTLAPTDLRRHWPPEKFAALGNALVAAGARVAVLGTTPECPIVEAVITTMHAAAEALCDRLSLGGLAGLLSQAALMISNDSGPLHFAAAVGTLTVGIFWCGNLITSGPLTRTRHRRSSPGAWNALAAARIPSHRHASTGIPLLRMCWWKM